MSNTLKLGNGKWATGKDTLLSFSDTNNNYKPLPFSFSRASSGTVVNKAGLIETVGAGEPRIDFKDNTKGALLLEPSRTNRMTTSEPTSGGNGFVYNPRTWGNGLSNGFTANDASGGAPKYYYMAQGIANEHSAFSFYIEMADGSEPTIGSSSDVNADLSVMVKSYFLSESDVIKTNTINNIWKIQGTSLPQSLSGTGQIGVLKYSAHSNKTFYATGFQIEQGSYATSYIPTSGSAVTRVGDVCNNGANEQVINSTEGVLYFEGSAFTDSDSLYRLISLKSSQSTYNDRVEFGFRNDGIYASIASNNSEKLIYNQSIPNTLVFNKIALKYSNTSGCSLYLNGVELTNGSNTDFSANDFDGLEFDNHFGNSFYGNIKDVKLYNTALTDQELITLTTI